MTGRKKSVKAKEWTLTGRNKQITLTCRYESRKCKIHKKGLSKDETKLHT